MLKRIYLVFLIVGLWVCPAMAQENTSFVRTELDDTGAKIIFDLHQESAFKAYISGQELLVSLENSLGTISVEEANQSLPGWLEYISTGYDSFLVRVVENVTFSVTGDGDTIRILLQKDKAAEPAEPEQAAENQLRYKLGKAQILAQNNKPIHARRILKELEAQNPDNLEVTRGLAGIEEQLGRYAVARIYYNRALEVEPDSSDLQAARQRMLDQTQPRLDIDHYWRFVRNADRQMATSLVFTQPQAGTAAFSVRAERRKVWDDEVRRADGSLSGFYGQRYKADFSVLWPRDDLLNLTARLFASDNGAGVGFSVQQQHNNSNWQALVSLYEPNWDFIEGIVNYGTRHRAGLAYSKVFAGAWRTSAAGYLNSYSLDNHNDATRTASAQLGVGYDIRPATGVLSFDYVVDGEYALNTDQKTDNQGTLYRVVPITTREVHSVTTTWLYETAGDTAFAPYAGYSYDRYNKGGPIIGFRIDHTLDNRFDMGLYASRSIAKVTGAGSVTDQIGANLQIRF